MLIVIDIWTEKEIALNVFWKETFIRKRRSLKIIGINRKREEDPRRKEKRRNKKAI